MKVITEEKDRYGKYPIKFVGAKLEEINQYLFQNFNGYKFCIVFDETKDEYEPLGKTVFVYFMDEILDEAADYAGKKIVEGVKQ